MEKTTERIGRELRDTLRETIEQCGAEYVGIRNDSVLLRDPASDKVFSLYIFACSRENVRLTLKSARDNARAAMWEFA